MEKVVSVIKALADEQRLKILRYLAEQEMGVCEVIHRVKLSQPAVSHHLKILKQVKLIRSEKQGKMVFYSLNQVGIDNLAGEMGGYLKNLVRASKNSKPSPLRENPNLCIDLDSKIEDCEKEL